MTPLEALERACQELLRRLNRPGSPLEFQYSTGGMVFSLNNLEVTARSTSADVTSILRQGLATRHHLAKGALLVLSTHATDSTTTWIQLARASQPAKAA